MTVFFTKVGWEPGKLKAKADPGTLPGCHLVRNGNCGGIYQGLFIPAHSIKPCKVKVWRHDAYVTYEPPLGVIMEQGK